MEQTPCSIGSEHTLWDVWGVILRHIWESFWMPGVILGLCWGAIFGICWGSFWAHAGGHFGPTLGSFWAYGGGHFCFDGGHFGPILGVILGLRWVSFWDLWSRVCLFRRYGTDPLFHRYGAGFVPYTYIYPHICAYISICIEFAGPSCRAPLQGRAA